jgi:thiol-disulfide isomerase/thioredoxin
MTTLHVFALLAALSNPGQPVLLDFCADWCAPCRSMEPTMRRLMAEGYAVRQVNIDQDRQLAQQFRVDRVPTFVLVADGRELSRVVGPTSFERLRSMFAAAPAKAHAAATPPPGAPAVPGGTASGPAPRPPQAGDAQARALSATVRLRVEDRDGNSFGTGTIIDTHGDEALIATCAHIFRDSGGQGPISVDLIAPGASGPLTGQLISCDLQHDVALVSIRPGIRITPAPVAADGYRLQRGDRVFSIGCDHGGQPSVRQSQITALNKYQGPPNIEATGQPVIGRSGGGLFSADGQLIGICNLADPKDNVGIYAALSLVHQNLDKIGQTRIYKRAAQLSAAPPPPSMSDRMPRPPLHQDVPSPASVMPNPVPAPFLAAAGAEDTEVICIVRSKNNPKSRGEVYFLDRPPRDLLDRLARESQQPNSREPVVLQAAQSATPGARTPPERWSNDNAPVVRGQVGQ